MTDQPAGPGFSTLALHAGWPGHPCPASLPADGACRHLAARLGPANALLEERMAVLEGGTAALALASGEAAQFLVLNMLLHEGDELIVIKRGGRLDPTAEAYQRFDWRMVSLNPGNLVDFEQVLSPRSKAILVESLSAVDGTIADLTAIAARAKAARLPLIVDNTLATPYLIRPIDHGADVIIHSTPQMLGGQGKLTGGLIIEAGSFSFAGDPRFPLLSQPRAELDGKSFAETYGNFALISACRLLGLAEFGPALSAEQAQWLLAGLETLAVRVERQSASALSIARHLATHPAVSSVTYPGLADDPVDAPAPLESPRSAGALLSFTHAGGFHAARACVEKLQLFAPLEPLGAAHSRAEHPASSRLRHLDDVAKDEAGAAPDLIRLSIGLEDVADLIADLDQALASS